MTTVQQADTFNQARGYDDWTALSDDQKSAVLNQAADYILAAYVLIPITSADQQARLDQAVMMIARDLANNPDDLVLRSATPVLKSDLELNGLKKIISYGETPSDPFPLVTKLLKPITQEAQTPGRGFINWVQAS